MKYSEELRVKPGTKVDLGKHDPAFHGEIASKKEARKVVKDNTKRLQELQYLLYAEDKRALLIVLQAMDAGGKDGTIRKVLGPVNPQGCHVTSFKVPTAEELGHDFLWRIHRAAPKRGMIGVFNRSHYEDVLIVRVHELVGRKVWSKRYDQINAFEKTLSAGGVHVLKFFLHISRDAQLARFRKRIENPKKHWKISPADFAERKRWDDYMRAYEDALGRCSTEHAPWFIIPADHKWFRDVAISSILVETLESLDMKLPEPVVDVSKIVIE